MNSLVRINKDALSPFSNFLSFRDEAEHILDSFLNSGFTRYAEMPRPAVDIVEDKDKYLVKAELPGVKQEDIDVSFEKNILTIKGKKEVEKSTEENEVLRTERSCGAFTRSFHIPSEVRMEDIDAKYKNGILEITLPKEEETKPKQIEIKVD